jgi:enoyl-CoA hydratase
MLAFTKIGLMPDGGATALVAASMGRAKAMRMALLAERLPADEAESLGLISHVFDADTFDKDVEDVIAGLRTGPMVGYARTKHAVNAATLVELDDAFAREREGQLGLLAAPDFVEGTAAFNEKRPPTFRDTP